MGDAFAPELTMREPLFRGIADPRSRRFLEHAVRCFAGFWSASPSCVVPAASEAGTISYQSGSEQQVLTLINQIRQQHRLARLTLSTPLRGVARAHSLDMLQHAYFDHAADDASSTVSGSLSGETIAWGVGSYGTPSGLVGQWMHSTPHRALILAPGIRRVGIGIALGTSAARATRSWRPPTSRADGGAQPPRRPRGARP